MQSLIYNNDNSCIKMSSSRNYSNLYALLRIVILLTVEKCEVTICLPVAISNFRRICQPQS